jgi:uncharacterized tellurite resistance protein B-like protein
MRTYPRNSPQAAARIVALTVLADGHFCKAEIDALQRLSAHQQLGLDAGQWQTVVNDFCEDMLATAYRPWGADCETDMDTLTALMADIEDADLRAKLHRLCTAAAQADGRLTDTESFILAAATERWELGREGARAAKAKPQAQAMHA